MPSGRGNAFAFLGLLTGVVWALAGIPALAQANDPLPAAPPGGGFGLPVDCAMGSVCSIQNYIDHDPGPGWLDHTCGSLSYDGHRGIDFRVPTQIDMRRGVAVIAAADGEVVIAKDGQPDLLMADTGPGKTREERNGNWVAIRHGDGWVTTYAHLRQGSVAVSQGQRVARGQKLGLIGLSGNSDFPHVHFAVTHEHRLLDPFTGQEPAAACGGAEQSLWSPAAQAQLAYRSGGLLSAGLLDRQAESEEIYAGIEPPASLSKESPVLVFWASLWGLREGDRLSLTVIAPNDVIVVTHAESLDRHSAQSSHSVSRKRPEQGWPVGRYRGILRVEREMVDTSVTVVEAQREIEVR
ncbi:M23 family metallopeptidase [Pelagibius sp. 7325]|uniref:M23 family metallopeptidase n=1 Tax=Pelagibius sp. 7325 TaxID=3131994 RepID=UPI0030EBCA14